MQANTLPPLPALTGATPPPGQFSARLGDLVRLQGLHLDAGPVTLQLNNARQGQRLSLPPTAGGSASQISVQLPDGPPYDPPGSPSPSPRWPADWGPGLYSLSASVGTHTTNAVPLAVAPEVTLITPMTHVQGDVTYTVTVKPQVAPGQRVSLLLGDREVLAQPLGSTPTDTLTFTAKALTPGLYLVRLRVDGVDSLLVNSAVSPPTFVVIPGKTQVEVTP